MLLALARGGVYGCIVDLPASYSLFALLMNSFILLFSSDIHSVSGVFDSAQPDRNAPITAPASMTIYVVEIVKTFVVTYRMSPILVTNAAIDRNVLIFPWGCMDTRVCIDCGLELPLDSFYLRKKDGYYYKRCFSCEAVKKHQYYEDNIDLFRSFRRRYYDENSDLIKEYSRQYYHSDRGKLLRQSDSFKVRRKIVRYKSNRSMKGKYRSYKSDAKRRDIPFNLTFEEFITFWQKPCTYCGSEIETIGIDRVDSNLSYHLSNCVSCCIVCNRMKTDLSLDQWCDSMFSILKFLGRI